MVPSCTFPFKEQELITSGLLTKGPEKEASRTRLIHFFIMHVMYEICTAMEVRLQYT